jgi:hypothetical protein
MKACLPNALRSVSAQNPSSEAVHPPPSLTAAQNSGNILAIPLNRGSRFEATLSHHNSLAPVIKDIGESWCTANHGLEGLRGGANLYYLFGPPVR